MTFSCCLQTTVSHEGLEVGVLYYEYYETETMSEEFELREMLTRITIVAPTVPSISEMDNRLAPNKIRFCNEKRRTNLS